MTKFKIVDDNGKTISTHKNINLANAKLRKIDAVKYSLYASDVDWLNGMDEALQGYKYAVIAVKND